jgi:hypothetical protein
VSRIADREKRLRHLVEANVALGSEASLDDVLPISIDRTPPEGWFNPDNFGDELSSLRFGMRA